MYKEIPEKDTIEKKILKFGAFPSFKLGVNFNFFSSLKSLRHTDAIYLFIILVFKGNKISSFII